MIAQTIADARAESLQRRQRELTRVLGSTIGNALADENVVEVLVNPDGRIWLDRLEGGLIDSGLRMSPDTVEAAIVTIANELRSTVYEGAPSLSGELPWDGSRVQALLPPASPHGPTLVLRKHAGRSITLDEYVAQGVITPTHAAQLRALVAERKNLIVAGGTGSGKTTLGNALLHEIARFTPHDRVVILEDTLELRCPLENVVHLQSSPARGFQELLRDTLRLRPTRIIFGELRDKVAHDFIKALNTGHSGSFTTLHANSALEALERLEDLIAEAGVPPIPRRIASAIHAVLFIVRDGDRRHLTEFVRIDGIDAHASYLLTPLP